MEKIKFIDDFYYQKENLPEDFYENIVELENLHYRNKFFKGFTDVNVIEELASKYKQAVEHFCQVDKEKENYFYEKMQNLLSNDKIIKLMDDNNEMISRQTNATPIIFTIGEGNNEMNINDHTKTKNNYNSIKADEISIKNKKENAHNSINHKANRKISNESFISKFDKENMDTKKRKRFSMRFKLIMNKMKFNSQKTNTDEMQNKTIEDLNNGVSILNENIETQERSFKLRLENAKKEKKILIIANHSALGNSFENGQNFSNEFALNNFNISSNNYKDNDNDNNNNNVNGNLEHISSSLTRKNSSKEKNKSFEKHENNKNVDNNNELVLINNNLNLSFLSRSKKSINHIIDNFLKEFLHVYLDKTSNGVIKNVLKNFEDFYNEKKKYFVKYQEELSIFNQMTDEKGEIKDSSDIDESIKLLMQSLIMERNEKLQMQDKLLAKILNEIKVKGESLDLNNDEDFNLIINSVCEKIMSIFI